jgi:hypothetical protein
MTGRAPPQGFEEIKARRRGLHRVTQVRDVVTQQVVLGHQREELVTRNEVPASERMVRQLTEQLGVTA